MEISYHVKILCVTYLAFALFRQKGGGGGYMSIFRAARSVIEVTYCCVKDSEGGGMTKPGRSPPWRLNYRNI